MATKTDAEKYAELREASLALLSAIRRVHTDREYQRVWQLYELHGFTYRGPSYAGPIQDVIAVLESHLPPVAEDPVDDVQDAPA